MIASRFGAPMKPRAPAQPAGMDGQHEQQVLEVFQLLCSTVTLEPRLLCTLLQVSTQVNQALRQCRGRCCIKRRVTGWDGNFRPASFAGLAAWLPQHAGLVQSLNITRDSYPPANSRGSQLDDTEELSTHLLDTALQLATAPARQPPAAPGAAGHGPAHSQGSTKALTLQLEEFSARYLVSTRGLLALATCTGLRSASIYYRAAYASPAFAQALGQLTSLRELSLFGRFGERLPDQLASAVSTLSGLTRFTCNTLATRNVPHLPATLQWLDVTWEDTGEEGSGVRADLGRLTALQHAKLHNDGGKQMAITLPAQLTSLHLDGSLLVTGSTGLHSLHCTADGGCAEELCMDVFNILNTTSTLAQLQELWVVAKNLHSSGTYMPTQRLQQVTTAVRHLTTLTGLVVDLQGAYSMELNLEAAAICESLSSLKRLQSLVLFAPTGKCCDEMPTDVVIPTHDLRHLAALTQLTHLSLFAPSLNDFCAVCLLGKLTRLQRLRCATNSILTGGFLAVLPGLTDLSSLELEVESCPCPCDLGDLHAQRGGRFNWVRDELMQLSTLTKLQHVYVHPESSYMPDLLASLNLPPYPALGSRRCRDLLYDWGHNGYDGYDHRQSRDSYEDSP